MNVFRDLSYVYVCVILCVCVCGSVVICIDSARFEKILDDENGKRLILVPFLCGSQFYDHTNRREMENMEKMFVYIHCKNC